MDERYLTSFEDQTTALGYTSGDTTLVSPQVSLIGTDVVYSKEIPNESRIRFAKDEATGKLYFIIDGVDSPYVTFTAEEDNSSIGLAKLSRNQTMEYSTDATTWNTFNTTTNVSLNNGDKVYVRGVLSGDNDGYENNSQFKMSGKISASGNCNAILNYQDLNAPLKNYCGYLMFRDCTSLTTAPELPAIELTNSCYSMMFSGCTSLTTAPELPATTLASGCYDSMFNSCTSLTTAPELPATMLVPHCYNNMFRDCTSLTTAPKLHATTLATYCCSQMFFNCTSLTTAPELPATALVDHCYSGMFYGCTSLITEPELPATTLADYCYYQMFSGCISLAAAPELPATTLANSCYGGMFYDCNSLTTAPELPATMLAKFCYSQMFRNCTKLNHITCLATDISAGNCTQGWVYGVSGTGTFIKHPDMNNWTTGISGIPEGWTVIDADLAE